jgi:hypothetical protein
MNSTDKILKIFGFVRKRLPKGAMILDVSPERGGDAREPKLISFYETGDEVFLSFFPR